MNRRDFIKSSASVGAVVGLSGCIGPIRKRLPFWNKEMSDIYPNTMTNIAPLESHLNSSGRISIEVNKEKLDNQFDNIYEDPYKGYNTDISSLLHSRSALSSVQPIVKERVSGHVGESDILNKLNLSSEYSEVSSINRFFISEDLIIFNGSLSRDVIERLWDVTEVSKDKINYQYQLFNDKESWVAVGNDWFGIPLVDYGEDDVINRFNQQSMIMSGKEKSTSVKNLNNGVSFGDINIAEIGTDLKFIKDEFGIGADGILSTATFTNNSLETSTAINFTEDFTKSDVGSVVNSINSEFNITVNESVAIINVVW